MVKSSGNGSGLPSDECPGDTSGQGLGSEGSYEWNAPQQGWVISIYFAGYLVGMFPAGYFADRSVEFQRSMFIDS